jgi:phage-related protein
MSDLTYSSSLSPSDKPLIWLHGEIKTPPFSREARIEAGCLLRLLQKGQAVGMPRSRPMPVVGPRCHELRVREAAADWRIVYRLDADTVVILEVFRK